MGLAAEISLVSCMQIEILVISDLHPVSVAIFDLPLTLTSHSNRSTPVVLSDPKT